MRAITRLAFAALASCAALAHVPAQAQDYGEPSAPPGEGPPAPSPGPYPEPEPQPYPQPAPQPQPYPQPAPQPYPQQPYPQQPPPPQPQPYPQQSPPPPQSPPPQQPAQRFEGEAGYSYGDDYPEAGGEGSGEGQGKGFEMPGFSIRLDPFNWLLEGRLGLELEVGLWKIITFEMVPVFVAANEPPLFNLSGRDDSVSQTSIGLGPIAGTSLGLGFWVQGEAFRGYVLRALFTNYGYAYKGSDGAGTFDRVEHVERRLGGFFGSYSRFGFFTIGGGIGLMYELHQGERCDPVLTNVNGTNQLVGDPAKGCDELHIALERPSASNPAPDIADLNGWLHPVYLSVRFSLGVAFD